MTFNEIWDEYISNKRKRIKPSSVSAYTFLWKQVKGFFGDKEITSITTKMVEKWAMEQLDYFSKKTVKERINLVNNIIDYYGYEYEVNVSKINMKYIHWPTRNACNGELDGVKTFTPRDIKALLARIAEDPQPQNVLIAVMIGTGIRIGEACALTYGNVNTDEKTIEIQGTLERISVDKDYPDEDFARMNVKVLDRSKDGALILSTPKCVSSRRSIPLPGELVKVLKRFKAVYPDNYYIGSNAFKPVEPRILRNYYYKLLESAGIEKRLSPHSLRHTYATNLITSGVDIKTAAALLGHGDTGTTLGIYSHATAESKQKAMASTIGKQFKAGLLLK